MNSGQFITDVVVVSSKDKCPSGYTIVSIFRVKIYAVSVTLNMALILYRFRLHKTGLNLPRFCYKTL